MNTGLIIARDGFADDVPLTFLASKTPVLAKDGAPFRFRAEVWCPQSELNDRSAALRDFLEQIHKTGSTKFLELAFGPPHAPPGMKAHAGMCTVRFVLQESGKMLVSTDLVSVPPGANVRDLRDSCALHFDTSLAEMDDFLDQLEKSSSGAVAAALRGDDASD